MVNNEFHIIGVATSNYQNIGNKDYKSYLLKVEVEKFGSKVGNSFEVEVQIYGTNKSVNVKEETLGRQVAVNGYVDSYLTKEGNRITKLVAQNVYVLGVAEVGDVVEESDCAMPAREQDIQPSPSDLDGISIPDDDLPF